MKPYLFSSKTKTLVITAFSGISLTPLCHADAVFDFNNGTSLDNVGVGATMAALDTTSSVNVTLTTVEIIGQDGSLASDGFQLHRTNISTSSNALGINDATNPNGSNNDSRDFDPGEAWIFSFDVDVTLTSIDFAGQSEGETFTISSAEFDDIILAEGQENDFHSLLDTPVSAGTPIMIQMNVPHTEGFGSRISELSIAAIPDNSGGVNLIWAGTDGDQWNNADPNFTGDDTQFTSGANVEIQTAGAINIESAGIDAGAISVTTPRGLITLQGGNLNSDSFSISEASTVNIASPVTFNTGTGVTTLSNGTLQISNGATFSTGLILLSGGTNLELNDGATMTATNGGAISTGGATLDLESPLILSSLTSDVIEAPLRKTGSETLTFAGDLGIRTTGPVNLELAEGSVVAADGSQLNLSGESTIDGDLILDGGRLELHGSTLSGTGSIIAQSGDATIDSRFQGGAVTVNNNILLNSDLMLEAPTNGGSNSELTVNGIISGTHNLIKIGNGLVSLDVANTYTGNTTVESGVLRLGSASLNDSSAVFINNEGVLNLAHANGDTVDTLTINGIEFPPGTYGSSNVTAITPQNINDDYFAGDGWLIVTSGPITSDYDLWAITSGFTLSGGMDDDDDNDGLSNQEEYAFGLNPVLARRTTPFTSALDRSTGQFTYTRRSTSAFDTGLTYSYAYSTDLDGFTLFTADTESSDSGNPVESVTVTIPTALLANDKLFVRIIVE